MLRKKLYSGTLIGAALLLAITTASTVQAKTENFQDSFEKSYPIDPSARFTFEGVSDELSLRTWEKETVEVRATFKGKGEAPEVRIDTDTEDFSIEVDHDSGRKKTKSVTFEIRIPEGVQADIKGVSGDFSILGIKGGLRAETVSGDITADGIGRKVIVETVSGDLSIDRCEVKQFKAESVSGEILAADLKTGDLVAETVSGDVLCKKVRSESIRLATVSGDVIYKGEIVEEGTYEISTYSGDVMLSIPPSSSFRIGMDTFSGDLTCDFALEKIAKENGEKLSGVHGGGKSEIKVKTFSGDVMIRKGEGVKTPAVN